MLKITRDESVYVLAVWSGERRYKNPKLIKNPTYYIKNHIDSLKSLDHNISSILVMVAHNPIQNKEFNDYLNNLPIKIKNSKLEIINRPNNGMSYGALSDAFEKYRTKYKYYFFIEDDYIFAQNNFDKIHINMLENKKCAYMCAAAGANGNYSRHAMISTGCIRSDALENLFIKNGNTLWPYPKRELLPSQKALYGIVESLGQYGMSKGLIDCGYTIEDVGDEYISQWRGSRGTIKNYHEDNNKFKPIMTTFV